jgi:hypothetical protein
MRAFQRPINAVAAAKIPKPLHKRVNERIQQLAQEQKHEAEALQNNEDSEDSENSLLQANGLNNASPMDSDHDSVEEVRTPQLVFQPRSSSVPESDRLLATIGSDLSDAAFFEEEDSVSSSAGMNNSFLKSSPNPRRVLDHVSSIDNNSNLLHSHDEAVPPPWETKTVQHIQTVQEIQGRNTMASVSMPTMTEPSICAAHRVVTVVTPPSLAQKFFSGTALVVLLACLTYQLTVFPTRYLAWCATVLSLCLSCTLLWPQHCLTPSHKRSQKMATVERKQTLLGEGLPYRSRQVVAQANIRRLNHKIRLLKKLQAVEHSFRERQQQHSLALTVQVLLKSNRSATSCHLNALTLSVLPSKLATIGVKVDKTLLAALAKSRRGSRVILFDFFRDLLAENPAMFTYPPLPVTKYSSSRKQKIKDPKRRSKLQRVEAI